MKRGARVGDVGACRFDGAMLGIDQVDLRNARRSRQHLARQVTPAAAEIGDVTREVVGQMSGEQRRAVVDAIPGEDAGLAEPRAVADRPQRSKVAPVVGRRSCRRASARRRGNGTSRACRRGRTPCRPASPGWRRHRRWSPSRPACRPRRAATSRARCWRSSLPCAWSAGAGRAGRRRSRCAARPTSRPSSGGDTPAGTTARRRCPGRAKARRAGRTPAAGERSGFEGVDEGAAGLAHGTTTERGRRVP